MPFLEPAVSPCVGMENYYDMMADEDAYSEEDYEESEEEVDDFDDLEEDGAW